MRPNPVFPFAFERKYKKLTGILKNYVKKKSTLEYGQLWDVMMDDKKGKTGYISR